MPASYHACIWPVDVDWRTSALPQTRLHSEGGPKILCICRRPLLYAPRLLVSVASRSWDGSGNIRLRLRYGARCLHAVAPSFCSSRFRSSCRSVGRLYPIAPEDHVRLSALTKAASFTLRAAALLCSDDEVGVRTFGFAVRRRERREFWALCADEGVLCR